MLLTILTGQSEAQGYKVTTWLDGIIFDSTGNINPPAPTAGVVNDSSDTFAFTLASGYLLSDHEYSIDAGLSYATVTANPISFGDVALSVGQVKVRVKAVTGRNAGAALSNGIAFTVATGGGGVTWSTSKTAFIAEATPPTLPSAGGKFNDTVFGTQIMRVTDASTSGGQSFGTNYSYWDTFNVDNTKLLIGNFVFNFDPVNFTLGTKTALSGYTGTGAGFQSFEDAIWSTASANVIYSHSGGRVVSLNVTTGVYTVVGDLQSRIGTGNYLWQMSMSRDDDVFGFTIKDSSSADIGYLAWKKSTDTVLYKVMTTQLDEVQVDKSGRWLVIKTGNSSTPTPASAIEVKVADLQTSPVTVVDLTNGDPDDSPGHSDNKSGYAVGEDDWTPSATYRSLATPHTFSKVLTYNSYAASVGGHISARNDDPNWALYSVYPQSPLEIGNEILVFRLDLSNTVRRFVQHHSRVWNAGSADYNASPKANISRDGKFCAFTSNWGTVGGRTDLFIARIPDGIYSNN